MQELPSGVSLGNPESCCSLSIPLPATSITLLRKWSFQLHPTAISFPGRGCDSRDAVVPHRAQERCSSVPGLSVSPCSCPELLLELPCLVCAVLHQLCSLPQQKHLIQVTLVTISSRKEFIWVWVRKSVSCWLPDPLSWPDLFIDTAQPGRYLTPGIRVSFELQKGFKEVGQKKKKHSVSLCQALEICY